MFNGLSFSAIQEEVTNADRSGLPPLKLTILRNVTVEPIAPYLSFAALRMGLAPTVVFGNFDTILQDAMSGEGLEPDTDAVVVVTYLEQMSRALARGFATLSAAEIDEEIERIDSYVAATLEALRAKSRATILWLGFEPPARPALGILDSQGRGQAEAITELNRRLRIRLSQAGGGFLVDNAACLARLGAAAFYDPRYWHMGKAPYSRAALGEIATELARYLRALKGRAAKCLVLDCDNTLWGGIVGEDGVEGIKLGPDHPGSSFLDVQQEALNLHHRGVLLALCSKNEADDVWAVFDRHPHMLLKREHIAAFRINWQDKASNLREIARELNIGLDALVHADDSDFEVNLIRAELPEVAVIHLPTATPYLHGGRIAAANLFDTLSLTAEDRDRAAMYRAEAQRTALREAVTDLAGYCRSLEMVLELRFAEPASVPRLAQLTQKTNQFNLTTRRYGEGDVAALAADGDVLSVHLSDRFGSAGLVGECILRYDGGDAVIDTLLLSCRVLGRGVEDALIAEAARLARLRGARRLVGEYRPTAKNGQVAGFYAQRGFATIAETDEGVRYAMDLEACSLAVPDIFKTVASAVDTVEEKV